MQKSQRFLISVFKRTLFNFNQLDHYTLNITLTLGNVFSTSLFRVC